MSSSTGPRGRRHPPAVYRRRRIVALLILLLVVAGIAWGVSALLGRDAGATRAAAEQPAEAAPTEAPPSPGHVDTCTVADLQTDVLLDPAAPTAGSRTSFRVTVRNAGTQPCLLDAAPSALAATVVSGPDTVWSSAHCAKDGTEELLLDAGGESVTTVAWKGRHSAAGCPPDQPHAPAGTYRVVLELAGEPLGTPETFTLG